MKITKSEFGMTKDNQPISLYTIENASGASVTLSDYGCRIIKIMVPIRGLGTTSGRNIRARGGFGIQ